MRLLGYCRYSSDHQSQVSIEIQKKYIEAFCEQNGYELVQVYADYAKSGSNTVGRDAFNEMYERVMNDPEIDGIVAHKIDRAARHATHSVMLAEELYSIGKEIFFVNEKPTKGLTKESKLNLTVCSAIAEFELAAITERTQNGIHHKAIEGGFLGGNPPLGYRKDEATGKLLVVQEQAKIVQEIFDMYVNQRLGYGSIAKNLNNQGYLTQRKQEFTKNSIRGILENEKYIGINFYNKRAGKTIGADGKAHYNNSKHKDDSEIIRHYDAHEAIISKEQFEAAQELLSIKSNRGGRRSNSLFMGRIACECGSPMHLDCNNATSKNGKRYKIRKYRCNQYNNGKDHPKIDADITERQVLSMIKAGTIEEIDAEVLLKELDNFYMEKSTNVKQMRLHEEKKVQFEAKLGKMLDVIAMTDNPNTMAKINMKISEYERCIDEAQKKIDSLKERCTRNYTAEEIKNVLDNFEALAMEYARQDEVRNMVGSYIDSIKVTNKVVEIIFNDSCYTPIAS